MCFVFLLLVLRVGVSETENVRAVCTKFKERLAERLTENVQQVEAEAAHRLPT